LARLYCHLLPRDTAYVTGLQLSANQWEIGENETFQLELDPKTGVISILSYQ